MATRRRETSEEALRDDIGNETSMGTIDGAVTWGPGLSMPRARATMARRRCAEGPPDVATSAERNGYSEDGDANRGA